ncbi:MAG: dephospho-CoA kinase [Alphaproteobacteria bacterium]|nr:dephospho-CoA kinase [Alphaproteobacteria bacterium]
MIVVGLTGSIGMGKSVMARQFRRLRVPVHESDAAVHKLLRKGGAAVKAVAKAFPQTLVNGAIDRKKLGQIVFADDAARKKLEKILHPLVRADSSRFLKLCRAQGHKMAVLDIPLLFETHQEWRFDHILCVTAPHFVQKRRVLSRKGMTESRFQAVLALQLPDALKQRKSDTVVNTARGLRHSYAAAKKLKKRLLKGLIVPDGQKRDKNKKSLGNHARHP